MKAGGQSAAAACRLRQPAHWELCFKPPLACPLFAAPQLLKERGVQKPSKAAAQPADAAAAADDPLLLRVRRRIVDC